MNLHMSHLCNTYLCRSSGEDAKCLIAPLPIEIKSDEGSEQSYTATRNSSVKKAPKNYIKANRQALKAKQLSNKNAAILKEKNEKSKQLKIDQFREKQFGRITSRVHAPTLSSSTIAPNDEGRSINSNPLSLDEDAENQEFHIAFGQKVTVPSTSDSSRPSIGNTRDSGDSETFVRHKSYGKTPAYITNRRAKIEREEQERLLREQNAPPAPGLVLLEESERLETLRILEENEKIERHKLQNIPFAMNAQRAARMREGIEFRLKEIESAKSIFSKDRVFVAQSDDN